MDGRAGCREIAKPLSCHQASPNATVERAGGEYRALTRVASTATPIPPVVAATSWRHFRVMVGFFAFSRPAFMEESNQRAQNICAFRLWRPATCPVGSLIRFSSQTIGSSWSQSTRFRSSRIVPSFFGPITEVPPTDFPNSWRRRVAISSDSPWLSNSTIAFATNASRSLCWRKRMAPKSDAAEDFFAVESTLAPRLASRFVEWRDNLMTALASQGSLRGKSRRGRNLSRTPPQRLLASPPRLCFVERTGLRPSDYRRDGTRRVQQSRIPVRPCGHGHGVRLGSKALEPVSP